jgi:hypothetical protein
VMRLPLLAVLTALTLGAGGQSESMEGVLHVRDDGGQPERIEGMLRDGGGQCNYTDVTTGATFDLT